MAVRRRQPGLTVALALVFVAVGGVLVGGAWSLWRAGGHRLLAALLLVAGALAIADGLLRGRW